MKQKNIGKIILGGAMIFVAASCSLNFDPISDYSDVTEGISETGKEVVFKDKKAVEEYREYNKNQPIESDFDKDIKRLFNAVKK